MSGPGPVLCRVVVRPELIKWHVSHREHLGESDIFMMHIVNLFVRLDFESKLAVHPQKSD